MCMDGRGIVRMEGLMDEECTSMENRVNRVHISMMENSVDMDEECISIWRIICMDAQRVHIHGIRLDLHEKSHGQMDEECITMENRVDRWLTVSPWKIIWIDG